MICPGVQDGPLIVIILAALALGAAISFIALWRARYGTRMDPFEAEVYARVLERAPHGGGPWTAPVDPPRTAPEWITFSRERGFVYGREEQPR